MRTLRQLTALCALLYMLAALCVPAGAAVEVYDASDFDVRFTVAEDGAYEAAATLKLSFDAVDTSLRLPLGPAVTEADATGLDARLETDDDDIVWLVLATDTSFLVPGSYSISWSGRLPEPGEDAEADASVPLLCAQWPGEVSGVTFSVTLPKAVEEGDALLTSGYYGELSGSAVTLKIDNMTISGGFNGTLLDHESLSLDLTLPADYFTEPKPEVEPRSVGGLIVPVLCVLCLLYWIVTLRSPRTSCRPQLIPPDGVCAGDVPFLLFGTQPETILTILQWASLGYLQLHSGRPGAVVLERRMDMGNERKGYEQKLFSSVFVRLAAVNGDDPLLQRGCQSIERPLAAHWRKRIFDRRSGSPLLLQVLAAAACAVSCARAGLSLGQEIVPPWLLAALLAVAGFAAGLLICRGALKLRRKTGLPLIAAAAGALAALVLLGWFGGVPGGMLLACALTCFAGWMCAFGGRRTRAGRDLLARLRSLRRFFAGADQKQLRRLLRQDPQYFYRMLPFAEALGVGRRFAARFGSMRLEPCEYYQTGRVQATTAAEFYEWFRAAVQTMGEA